MTTEAITNCTLIATIAVAVIGWIIAIILQRKNLKNQHKIQIKYDIYKQLVQAKSDIQEPLNNLGTSIVTPFILMGSSMIPFKHNLKKQYKDILVDYTESECLIDGEQEWNNYVRELQKFASEFMGEYIKLMGIFENWESALSKLIQVRNILFAEINRLKKNIDNQISFFQMYSIEKGHDWRAWNQDDLKKRAEDIRDSSFEIGSYINDFMVLVHNKLMAQYFGYYRESRKTLDSKYKILTLKGLVENVDKKKVEEMKLNKKKLISCAQRNLDMSLLPNGNITSDYESFLRSVINGKCPVCNNPIEVYSMNLSDNEFCFNYICGHSWKGLTVSDTLTASELIKTKTKRFSFGWLRKTVQGWKPSGNPKLKKGVDVYMDANREANEYHHVVSNHETKEVIHKEHELLTEHKPH